MWLFCLSVYIFMHLPKTVKIWELKKLRTQLSNVFYRLNNLFLTLSILLYFIFIMPNKPRAIYIYIYKLLQKVCCDYKTFFPCRFLFYILIIYDILYYPPLPKYFSLSTLEHRFIKCIIISPQHILYKPCYAEDSWED